MLQCFFSNVLKTSVEILGSKTNIWRKGPDLPVVISGSPIVEHPRGGVLIIGGLGYPFTICLMQDQMLPGKLCHNSSKLHASGLQLSSSQIILLIVPTKYRTEMSFQCKQRRFFFSLIHCCNDQIINTVGWLLITKANLLSEKRI